MGKLIMTKSRFNNISLGGRLAYMIMCFEKFVLTKYPNHNYRKLFTELWKGTSENDWATLVDMVFDIMPIYFFENDHYVKENYSWLKEEDYDYYREIVSNIPEMEIILQAFKEFLYAYEGTPIKGTGQEATKQMFVLINLLESNNIELQNPSLVDFSKFEERNGWGNTFDGTRLSIVL